MDERLKSVDFWYETSGAAAAHDFFNDAANCIIGCGWMVCANSFHDKILRQF